MTRIAIRPLWLAFIVAILFAASPAAGQSVRGRTIDANSGQPVPGVRVQLFRADGGRVAEAISNADGVFQMAASGPGEYRLETSVIGYRDVSTSTFLIRDQEQIMVDVNLPVTAIELEPLTIVGRRVDPRHEATEDGFYARRLLSKPIGNARVFLPFDPEMRNAGNVLEVLRWTSPRRGCTTVFWNGRLVADSLVAQDWLETSVSQLEGIEYYRNPLDAPAAYRDLPIYLAFDHAYCSIVALWPRTGRYLAEPAPLSPDPFPWRAYLTAAFYRISGPDAPKLGFGIEAATHWPLWQKLAVGVHFRATHHQLDAGATASLTATASDISYLLPPGDRGLMMYVLGVEPRWTVAQSERFRVVVSTRLQVAQRRFTLQSTYAGNPAVSVSSRGWGAGVTAGFEKQLSDRFAADVSIGQDWLSFGPYDKLDREPAHTDANWTATALRIGIVYDVSR